jgi:DNA polymerase-1
MKRCMIVVDRALPTNAKIVLQIHDSLMIECPEAEATQIANLLKSKMENIAPELPVKLAVDLTIGKDWGQL